LSYLFSISASDSVEFVRVSLVDVELLGWSSFFSIGLGILAILLKVSPIILALNYNESSV